MKQEVMIKDIYGKEAKDFIIGKLMNKILDDDATVRVTIEEVDTRPFESFYDRVELDNEDIHRVEFPEKLIALYKENYEDEEDENEREWQVLQELEEDLLYWLVYYEPNIASVDVAIECGLIPFEYEGRFLLALGGAGMDLSPKLDAYQALTDHTIPENSKLFSDREHFEYVVGKELTEKVIEVIRKPRPRVIVYVE